MRISFIEQQIRGDIMADNLTIVVQVIVSELCTSQSL